MRRTGLLDLGLIVVVGVGWGMLAPGTKALFAANPAIFDGASVAVARAAWALPLFLFGLGAAWLHARPKLNAARWAAIAGAGLVFGPGITFLFSLAAQQTSVAHITFLFGLSPVTNTAAAALVFRLPLDLRQRIALGLGVAGVALLAATRSGGTAGLIGDGLMIGWLIAFAIYAVVLQFVGAAVTPIFTMCAVGVVAMSTVLAIAPAIPGGLRAVGHVADTPAIAGWFFGEIVLGSTILAQTAFAAAVRRLGVAAATIGGEYLAVAVGIAASLVAREPWTPLTVLAGATLAAALGVTFVRLPVRERSAAAP